MRLINLRLAEGGVRIDSDSGLRQLLLHHDMTASLAHDSKTMPCQDPADFWP